MFQTIYDDILAFMPQPGAGVMPTYPNAAGSNFPPYPTNNYSNYPPYPRPTDGSPASGYPHETVGGYPPPNSYVSIL